MAKAIGARRQGDEYQARVFWHYLLKLRTGDLVKSVCLDSDGITFVDDVVIKYHLPYRDRATGDRIGCDYCQCKYHVTAGGAFTYKNLLSPAFINNKSQSMLQRLYDAHVSLSDKQEEFRLFIISNWFWHPGDELAGHLSEERIRDTFYRGGKRSAAGRLRDEFLKHLCINEKQLREFLDRIRFRLGKNLTDLARELEPLLKLANLKPIDPTATNIIYDDLAWKLFEQGRNHFDQKSFNEMVHDEKLVVAPPSEYSEISIRSFPQETRRPQDIQKAHLDLCELFDGRFPRCESYWKKEIPKRVLSFLTGDSMASLSPPIHLFFDCHLSIAFLAGALVNPKSFPLIIPAQKTRASGYELWKEPRSSKNNLWKTDVTENIDGEVIIAISVTNPIENHLLPFIQSAGLESLSRIHLQPANGVGPNVVSNGEHAWQLGFELQTLLRRLLPAGCHKLHLFFSCPAALAYILGNALRHVTPIIQLYEHDFEGRKSELRYSPSIQFPIDCIT